MTNPWGEPPDWLEPMLTKYNVTLDFILRHQDDLEQTLTHVYRWRDADLFEQRLVEFIRCVHANRPTN